MFPKSSVRLLAALLVALSTCLHAQSQEAERSFGAARSLPLYEGTAPGSERWNYDETIIEGRSGPQVRNVVRPSLLYFPAENPVGTAMIVAPGGGFRMLMMSYEGVDIAKHLNKAGIDAFVLKYRLKQTGVGADRVDPATKGPQAGQDLHKLAADDGAKAVELIRSRAAEFKIDPSRIGMIGFSAGGGPARGAMAGGPASRPNFVALIYGAGRSGEKVSVPAQAPPLFLAVAADDENYQASIDTFMAWRAADVPCELHVFQMGAHGFLDKGGGADHFMDRVVEWIGGNGWLK